MPLPYGWSYCRHFSTFCVIVGGLGAQAQLGAGATSTGGGGLFGNQNKLGGGGGVFGSTPAQNQLGGRGLGVSGGGLFGGQQTSQAGGGLFGGANAGGGLFQQQQGTQLGGLGAQNQVCHSACIFGVALINSIVAGWRWSVQPWRYWVKPRPNRRAGAGRRVRDHRRGSRNSRHHWGAGWTWRCLTSLGRPQPVQARWNWSWDWIRTGTDSAWWWTESRWRCWWYWYRGLEFGRRRGTQHGV